MERFTQRARRVLSLAQESAERLKHNYIGTEHLLLGLMREEGGVASRVLRDLGLEQHKVEALVEELTRATTRVPTTPLDLSPGTKRVLELAVDEARRMGHHYIGTEHLLLGLVRMSEGVAIDVLKRLGLSPEEVRRQTRRVLKENPVQNTQPAPKTGGTDAEQFTELADRVMRFAQEEADILQHHYFGTEHLLLGLIRDEGGIAGRVLRDLGVELRQAEQLVAGLTIDQPRRLERGSDITPGAKRALELAIDEARRMGHHYVGTEHMLLGLVRQSDGVAIDVLQRLGINQAEVRRQTHRMMQENPVQTAQPATSETKTGAEAGQKAISEIDTERFTERTRRVLRLAQEEAEDLQHYYIGTEHLLLGLLHEVGGVASHVLRDLGLEQDKVKKLVEQLSRANARPRDPAKPLELAPGAKRVLELAVDEARRMGHHYIGTEHILLGLVRQSEGVAIDVLKRLNISPEEVRRQTRRVLKESPVQNARTATAEMEVTAPSPQKATSEIMSELFTEQTQLRSLRTVRNEPAISPSALAASPFFPLMHSVVIKVLEMIAENKLTTAQGTELLGVLLTELTLAPGEKVQLASQFKRGEGEEKRRLRVTLTNKDNDQSPLSFTFGLEAMLQNVDVLFSAILNNQTEAIVFDNGDAKIRIEVQIEEDQE